MFLFYFNIYVFNNTITHSEFDTIMIDKKIPILSFPSYVTVESFFSKFVLELKKYTTILSIVYRHTFFFKVITTPYIFETIILETLEIFSRFYNLVRGKSI